MTDEDDFKDLLMRLPNAPMCASHGCGQRTYGRKGLTNLCPMCDAIVVEMFHAQLVTPEMVEGIHNALAEQVATNVLTEAMRER